MTRGRRGWQRAATLAVVLGVALWFAAALPHLRFTTKITDFLPEDSENRGAQIAALLGETELARVMILDLSLGEPVAAPERLTTLANGLLRFLRGLPDVAVARSGVTEADAQAMLEFLQAWPPTTFVPRSAYTDEGLRARLTALRDQLGSPEGVVIRKFAPRDPLGGMWEPLQALREIQSGAQTAGAGEGTEGGASQRGSHAPGIVDDGGILFTADRQHAFVFVETRSSSFDSDAQRAFRAALEGWMASAALPPARLQTAGTAQFAIASETQIKGDVNRIGIISTVGILALFLLMFGSPRLIALGMVPMLFGSVVAVLVCHAWFGEIHGITIAFGTSLLGVGLDYVEHYYAHFVLMPDVPATTTMRRVAPSLVLGAVTTIIGFIGIGASGVLGLRQMAMFSMVAIVASIAATCWIVPLWMPARYRPPRTLSLVNRGMVAVLDRLTRRSWGRFGRPVALVVAVLALIAVATTVQLSDNVNMLVNETGAHVVDDREVRSRLGADAGSFAVITAAGGANRAAGGGANSAAGGGANSAASGGASAASDEALLVGIEAASAELARARAAGLLASFVSLDRLVPSHAEQTARWAAAREAAHRIRRIMTELDLVPDQFGPFWDALGMSDAAASTGSTDTPAPKLLSLADVRRSPLAPLLSAWMPAHSPPLALVPLFGAPDLPALRAQVPSATIIAPAETVVSLFRGMRTRTLVASAVGFAAILVLLAARYRSARKALIALAPAMLACVATVGTLVIAGVSLTILHLMSLLLVVSMGVDFGIFLIDTTETIEESARTMVSILTASITTLLSFGLLGLSESPGLAALGITVTLGVTYSLLFCLAAASSVGPRAAHASSQEAIAP